MRNGLYCEIPTGSETTKQAAPPSFKSIAANTPSSSALVVDNVRKGNPEGLDQLYGIFRNGSASFRRLSGAQDFEDSMHDVFIVVAETIRAGKLRDPNALTSYIHGVARMSLCSKIGVFALHKRLSNSLGQWVSINDRNSTPEEACADHERAGFMRGLLGTLPARECEILRRFYLNEETKEEICESMRLTLTQFRLAKSRAKQHLATSLARSTHGEKPSHTNTSRRRSTGYSSTTR